MPRENEASVNERSFIISAFREGIRLDERTLDEYRSIDLTFGDNGVADVSLGKTRIVARVSAEVTKPKEDRKFDGVVNVVVELSPMASPAFEANRPSEQETHLTHILTTILRRSGALNTESLCILAGQKVWNVRIDMHVLSHDGDLLSCASIAMMAALSQFRRPDVSVEGGDIRIWSPRERELVPLSLLHHPYVITYSVFPIVSDEEGAEDEGETNTKSIVADANFSEERLREGEIVVCMNRFGEVCYLEKVGGGPVDALSILSCTRRAMEKVKQIDDLVKAKISEDEKKRDVGGLMSELTAENERL